MRAPYDLGKCLLACAALATIGCDHATKHVATSALAGRPSQSFLQDTVRLTFAENTGGFLGLGSGLPVEVRTVLFVIAPALMLVILIAAGRGEKFNEITALGWTLFVAGGASNLISRVVAGSVVDFLNVGIGPVRTGVFNVADVAIMCGAGLVVLGQRNKPTAAVPDTEHPS
ncbi:MAG: signal peptidase II [Acidobacteria bacterium]|nr:signal peptidase II [Acidobacteriota bacterium]